MTQENEPFSNEANTNLRENPAGVTDTFDGARAESDAEILNRLGDNAALWAAEFNATAQRLGYPEMDEGWLIGWFANAIEHSHALRSRTIPPPPKGDPNE